MKIHEYQGKQILKKFGVTVPRGIHCTTVDDAVKAAETLGGKVWVVKAQIHAGGRGKGGGVKVATSLEKVREYVSPELFEQLKAERAELTGDQHTEVMYVDTQLVRADYGSDWAQVSVRFSGRYMDRQEQVEEDIKEVWHLERDLAKNNAPWHIVGIEQL